MVGSTNLIINYLPQTTTERELYIMFVTIGPVASCRVMKDLKTGYSYGFGFVNYENPEDAKKAIEQLNGREIFNKKIKVSYARPSGDAIKLTNLYVTNIPRHYTESDLVNLFSQYGTIVQKKLLLDKTTGMPRGVAFVRYDRREQAQLAIQNLDGIIPLGGTEQISVRVAEEHGKQKAAFYAGLQFGINQSLRRFENPQWGRGGTSGMPFGLMGGGMRGGHNNINSFNTNLVSCPVQSQRGFGVMRQEKFQQQRFDPISFRMPNNGHGNV